MRVQQDCGGGASYDDSFQFTNGKCVSVSGSTAASAMVTCTRTSTGATGAWRLKQWRKDSNCTGAADYVYTGVGNVCVVDTEAVMVDCSVVQSPPAPTPSPNAAIASVIVYMASNCDGLVTIGATGVYDNACSSTTYDGVQVHCSGTTSASAWTVQTSDAGCGGEASTISGVGPACLSQGLLESVQVDCTHVAANAFPGMPPPPFWTPLHLGLVIGGGSLLLFIISTTIKICVFRHIAKRRAASGFPATADDWSKLKCTCCPCCRPVDRRAVSQPSASSAPTGHSLGIQMLTNPMDATLGGAKWQQQQQQQQQHQHQHQQLMFARR